MKLLSILGTLAAAATLTAFATSNAGDDTLTATVTGRILFDGKVPPAEPLAITEKQAEGCCPSGVSMNTTDRSLLIGPDKGIANAVITISVKGAELEVSDKPFTIDQKMCRFEPHIVVLPVGSSIEFLNSDEVSHNVHTYSPKYDSLNETIGPGARKVIKLDKKGKIQIKCDIHPWMSGHAFITDTPFFAISGPDGKFSIEGLPPGKYKADIWHEKLPRTKTEVVVGEDGSVEPIEVTMGEKKKKGRRKKK